MKYETLQNEISSYNKPIELLLLRSEIRSYWNLIMSTQFSFIQPYVSANLEINFLLQIEIS